MKFELKTDLRSVEACIPPFIELVGVEPWKKRVDQLSKAAVDSPFQAKIISDYHWLEFILFHHIEKRETEKNINKKQITIELLAALFFVQTVINVHSNLSPSGRKILAGRLRSALKAETGFAPLYVEMTIARRLFDTGYDVEFSDLEGLAQFDLRFWKDGSQGEVECKSLSCDAGRKIHRKDFYRFMDTISDLLVSRAKDGAKDVLIVTLNGRMPASLEQQRVLSQAAKDILSRPDLKRIEGGFFTVTMQAHDARLEIALASGQREAYRLCQEVYGNNCHVSGPISPDGACLVVVRSQKEDDTSAAVLEAMKKAASQFSRTRPAFIGIQYEDIEPSDLLSLSLRRRAGLLSYYLFHRPDASHLAATYFCAYRGLIVSESAGRVGEPAFGVLNPISKPPFVATNYEPFFDHIPDAEFARLLGEPAPTESISNIPFDKQYPEEGTEP